MVHKINQIMMLSLSKERKEIGQTAEGHVSDNHVAFFSYSSQLSPASDTKNDVKHALRGVQHFI